MSSSSHLGYARIAAHGWAVDNPRVFACVLPCWVPPWTKLLDETGQPIGDLCKTWGPLANGRTHVRIRLTADTLAARPTLRDDLLAHRVLLACEMTPQGRRLVLADKIDFEKLAAAPASTVVHLLSPWQTVAA